MRIDDDPGRVDDRWRGVFRFLFVPIALFALVFCVLIYVFKFMPHPK